MPSFLLIGCRRDDKDTTIAVARKQVPGTVGYGRRLCGGAT